MTTLYRPVLIESAEQAEALTPGTVALERGEQGQTIGASIRVRGGWHITGEDTEDGTPHLYKHSDMVGDLALVPIEAEEKLHEHHGIKRTWPGGEILEITHPGHNDTDESRDYKRWVYSTPWETA